MSEIQGGPPPSPSVKPAKAAAEAVQPATEAAAQAAGEVASQDTSVAPVIESAAQIETASLPSVPTEGAQNNLIAEHDAINTKIGEIKADSSLSQSEKNTRIRDLQQQRDLVKNRIQETNKARQDEGASAEPTSAAPEGIQQAENGDLSADENLTPGERLADAKKYLTNLDKEYTELINRPETTEAELHALERRLGEARMHEQNMQHDMDRAQDRETIGATITSAVEDATKEFKLLLEAEGLARQKDREWFVEELKKRDGILEETIKASKMDEEKKKNLLAELAKIAATFAVGATISGVKETTSG